MDKIHQYVICVFLFLVRGYKFPLILIGALRPNLATIGLTAL